MKNTMKSFGLISLIAAAVLVSGCSTNKEKIFPHGETTMHDVWRNAGGGGMQQDLMDARSVLRRSINDAHITTLISLCTSIRT